MLVEVILAPFWALISLIIDLFPKVTAQDIARDTSFFDILGKGIGVIGAVNFVKIIGTITFWYTVSFAWAIIEWVYKKIPGVE